MILPATDETIAQFKLAEQTGELKAIEENTGIKIIINDDTEGAVNQLKEDADISPDNIIAFAFEGQEKTAKDILGEQNVFRMKEIQQFQYVPFSLLAMLVKAKLIAQSLEERQRGPYKSALEIIWRRLTGKED